MAAIRCSAANATYVFPVAATAAKQMERQMLKKLAQNEIFGVDALNLVVIAGATLLLLGAITTPASVTPPAAKGTAPLVETVTVTASPLAKLS
jgi:hypothetical protein